MKISYLGLQLVSIILEDVSLCVSRMQQFNNIRLCAIEHPHLCHPMLVQLSDKGAVCPHVLQGRNLVP